MQRSAGESCAAKLVECRPNTLLPQDEASDGLLGAIFSTDDDPQVFDRTEHSCYAGLRASIPFRGSRSGKLIIVSLSAFNSYNPLRVTEQDLQQLVVDEDIDSSFAVVVASFGSLPRASELGHPCMSMRTDGDGSYNRSYLLRFAEQDEDYWKIRQLGVHHAYSRAENSHFWILVHAHPPAKDVLSRILIQQFSTVEGCASFSAHPELLHSLIFDTYIPKWRWYLECLGDSYSDLAYEIGTVELKPEYQCRTTLATLQRCKRLLEKMAAIPAIMDALLRIALSMTSLQDALPGRELEMAISAHRHALIDIKSSSDVLVRQTQGLVDLLGNTLGLKNQQDAAQLNHHLLKLSIRTAKDSVVIRVVTLVTLFYLPATFVATLFGMNFFNFENTSKDIVVSHDIWIYFVVFAGLTGFTLLGWWTWMRIAAKDKNLDAAELEDEKV